jgi:hypothetical protein
LLVFTIQILLRVDHGNPQGMSHEHDYIHDGSQGAQGAHLHEHPEHTHAHDAHRTERRERGAHAPGQLSMSVLGKPSPCMALAARDTRSPLPGLRLEVL